MSELKILKKKRKSLLTVDKLAKYLNVPKSTIYQLTMREKIPHFHIGRLLRFDKKSIESWLSDGGCAG